MRSRIIGSSESVDSYLPMKNPTCLGQFLPLERGMDRLEPREALARLLKEKGEDFAGLSRLIGKNPAYIQQFIKRGTPRKLDEDDRRTIARYLGVDEALLG